MRLRYYDYYENPTRFTDDQLMEAGNSAESVSDQGIVRTFFAENKYRETHRTYCKVSPDMSAQLCEARVCVPVDHIKWPVPAFVVRLAESLVWMRQNGSTLDIGSVLVAGGVIPCIDDLRNFVSWRPSVHVSLCPTVCNLDTPMPHFTLIIRSDVGSLAEEDILAASLRAGRQEDDANNQLAFIRLVVGVALIMNGAAPALLDRDCLAKDEERYAKAPPERKRELVKKAERRTHRKGYYIGREQALPRATSRTDTPGELQGRALQYRHYRCGHFHTVCFGKGNLQRRVQWFPPTVVKPDLPVAPDYRKRYAVGK
jgi:hypothetical protein